MEKFKKLLGYFTIFLIVAAAVFVFSEIMQGKKQDIERQMFLDSINENKKSIAEYQLKVIEMETKIFAQLHAIDSLTHLKAKVKFVHNEKIKEIETFSVPRLSALISENITQDCDNTDIDFIIVNQDTAALFYKRDLQCVAQTFEKLKLNTQLLTFCEEEVLIQKNIIAGKDSIIILKDSSFSTLENSFSLCMQQNDKHQADIKKIKLQRNIIIIYAILRSFF